MTRNATIAQLARARDAAEMAMLMRVSRHAWPSLVQGFQSIGECEAFRVTLLLAGKDTRSARAAIQARKDMIEGLRLDRPSGGWRGRPPGCKDK